MTELDFDELDKAVNNLMASTTPSDAPLSQSPTGNESVTAVETPNETPVSPQPATMPVQQKGTATNTSAPLATKRRGQFMDVMHPSSDMKTTAVLPMKRQGISLTPMTSSPVVQETPTSTSPDTSSADTLTTVTPEATAIKVEPSPVDSNDTLKSEWPDPIDVAPHQDTITPASNIEPDSTAMPSQSSDISGIDMPSESPFLPDAKPEKRPLGALQSGTPEASVNDTLSTVPEAEVSDTEDIGTPVEPVVLPAELGDNVVSIESDTTVPIEDTTSQLEPETELEKKTPQQDTSTETSAVGTAPINGSIPQQYKEEVSSGDQTNGAIYDTANYHKAIEANNPKKGGSTLKWILWALLLLVVGAGGGAAYFIFTR